MQFAAPIIAAVLGILLLSGVSATPVNSTMSMMVQSAMLLSPQSISVTGRVESYTQSCFGTVWLAPQWPPQVWLQATCPNKQGKKTSTVINLNRCIANYNGVMHPVPDGHFGYTCQRNYWKLYNGQTLKVECDGPHGVVKSSLELGDFITNDDGQLRCFDFHGCTPHTPGCSDMPPWPW
ncbi:hypothetical protein FHL15_001778 [Xylaria flabelliformis]|uniref:Cyanovirin-N domain-containing protein n=1 Tax=Xylaria flabelliformis TaxID=2512241 RepID=A0A553IBC3_9PEZI|nr:hypothetical protein FHL15_001778 [Xylaria flabelliformis]